MPTTITSIVDPDNGPGTDYTSLASWEATEQKDLVAADETHVADCRSSAGSANTANLLVFGWTTDATHTITVRAVGDNRHKGVWDSSLFRMEMALNSENAITIGQACIIEGIQLTVKDSTAASMYGVQVLALAMGGDVTVKDCILRGKSAASGIGIFALPSSGDVFMVNNIVYDWDGSGGFGIFANNTADDPYAYNNTLYDCESGIGTVTGLVAKNNVVQSSTTGYAGTFAGGSANNLSDQADSPGSNAKNSVTLTFNDIAGDDFHLDVTDTDAIDTGVDLSADAAFSFSDDIDGHTRKAATWDRGADQAFPATLFVGDVLNNTVFGLHHNKIWITGNELMIRDNKLISVADGAIRYGMRNNIFTQR